MAPQRKCVRCGIPVGPKKHYCDACYEIHLREYGRERNRARRELDRNGKLQDKCLNCGKPLPLKKEPWGGYHRQGEPVFCSVKCRKARENRLARFSH